MDVRKFAADIFNGIDDDLKATFTPEQVVVMKTASEHVAMYYLDKLTDYVSEGDARAVKAILANIENTVSVVAKEGLKRSLVKAVTNVATIIAAL